jgi:prevent-host-death family protein
MACDEKSLTNRSTIRILIEESKGYVQGEIPMKFVSVRDLRLKPGKVWKMAKEEKDVVLTVNGRPVAILTGVDEDTFEAEIEAIRVARTLQALDSLHFHSTKKGTHQIPAEKIKAEIRAVRRERVE